MLILLGASVGLIYGKTDIPFEKIWESPLETGIATEEKYTDESKKNLGTEGTELKNIFTTPGTELDISEIACYIARDIYNDYSNFGDEGPRVGMNYYKKGLPFTTGSAYLVGIGSFNYKLTASNKDTDEATLKAFDSACWLCREPVATTVSTGITNLDEVCIDLQLRDRKVISVGFCNESFGTPYGDGTFSNNDCGAQLNTLAWRAHCDKLGTDEFCTANGVDKIYWSADPDDDSYAYNDTESDDTIEYDSNKLSDSRRYMYAVLWIPEGKRYDVVFTVLPIMASTSLDWDYIWKTLGQFQDNFRRNVLGNDYWEARVIADYILTPANPINIHNGLVKNIELAFVGEGRVDFKSCETFNECFPGWVSTKNARCVEDFYAGDVYDDVQYMPIRLLINATDADGNKITDADINKDIPAGTYRVVIKEWYNEWREANYGIWSSCFDRYDRSVTVLELGPLCTDTDGGNVLTKGTCTDESGSYLDVCTDATHVSEYICFADLCVSSVATPCPPATPNCVDGACVT